MTSKGIIRYAQDTTGPLRWQPPRASVTNRSEVLPALEEGSQCPQSPNSASAYQTLDNSESSEDCLFLNVRAPTNCSEETGCPVLVWIHSGGYGQGAGGNDLAPLITTNDNGFIGVGMNYRLGAFGFLSSDEVHRRGVANAGLLDQQLALHWVQQYIHLFGGDASRVTIFGESAGAGSVMLHDIAYGGTLGTSLFRNSITASR
ncbi:hypothetical protein LTR37_003220 [Vermiconidia calcicola]|uniref:Uncharacterized protein n=1 Tax=Vermiconidia calcicola TaxID=1690605 RepID=A0ACC3NTC3_9PEZI|nr:hypothetical protein LTR37_003220 [Vermiconidia calcicola]